MNFSKMKYPKPSRQPAKGGVRGTEYYKEIDTGRSEELLDDGRPILVEYWYDVETQHDCITAFYSTTDIEQWSPAQHRDYLIRNGVMEPDELEPATIQITDAAGHSMWSVNWVEKSVKV